VSGGISLADLARATRHEEKKLRAALAEEVERGRVERDGNGRFSLVTSSFPPEVLLALRRLERPITSRTGRPEGEPRALVHAPPRDVDGNYDSRRGRQGGTRR
jgi:hypothetical protein